MKAEALESRPAPPLAFPGPVSPLVSTVSAQDAVSGCSADSGKQKGEKNEHKNHDAGLAGRDQYGIESGNQMSGSGGGERRRGAGRGKRDRNLYGRLCRGGVSVPLLRGGL